MVAVLDQQIKTSLPKSLVLIGQWYGYRDPLVHAGKEYTHVLVRTPNELDLSNSEEYQSTLDYTESSNITSTTKTEVIADIDFIMAAQLLSLLTISGRCKAIANLECHGDNVYTTSIDSCRMTIIKRTSAGVESQLAQEEYPLEANQPVITNQFEYYTNETTFSMTKNITETTINVGDAVILRVEVFGHVNNVSASNNKIKLLFARGHVNTALMLSVVEDS